MSLIVLMESMSSASETRKMDRAKSLSVGMASKEAGALVSIGRLRALERDTRRACWTRPRHSDWSDLVSAWDGGKTLLRLIRMWWILLAFLCSELTCHMERTNMQSPRI